MNDIIINDNQCISIDEILNVYGINPNEKSKIPLILLIKLINNYYESINKN